MAVQRDTTGTIKNACVCLELSSIVRSNMAPDQGYSRRAPRKLTKKRKPVRASSVQYPERLRVGEDAQEDVTATHGKSAQYMNQSVFSMIAAAGSRVDFNARFDEESSESEDEAAIPRSEGLGHSPKSTTIPSRKAHESRGETIQKAHREKGQDKPHERQMSRVLPQLNLRTIQERNYMSQSIILPSPKDASSTEASPKNFTPRDAPVMSKMLEAQAQLSPSVEVSEDQQQDVIQDVTYGLANRPTALVLRLKEIFGFDNTEEVKSGAPSQMKRRISSLTHRQNIRAG